MELSWRLVVIWALPLAFILLGAAAGVLFERVVVRRLRRFTSRSAWVWDDVLLLSLKRAPTLLFTATGAWLATQLLPLDPQVRRILEKSLMVLVILSLTLVLARATGEGIRRFAARQGTFLPASSLVTNVAKLIVLLIGGLIIFQNLGVQITPIVGALGLGGLAVALALQPTLSNAVAGFQIIATRQVREGDYIQMDSGQEGYVVDVRWRNTTIRSILDDFQVIVPNSTLADTVVTNYSLPSRPLWVRIPVGVSYGSDLEQVERVTLEVAEELWRAYAHVREGEEPVLRFKEFGDSAITFRVRIMVDEFADQRVVIHHFIKSLHARYRAEGIEIPWPIRTLSVPKPIAVEWRRADDGGAPADERSEARSAGGGRAGSESAEDG